MSSPQAFANYSIYIYIYDSAQVEVNEKQSGTATFRIYSKSFFRLALPIGLNVEVFLDLKLHVEI
jgi:hypothetical protein